MQLPQLEKLGLSLVILSTLSACNGNVRDSFCDIYQSVPYDEATPLYVEEAINFNEAPFDECDN